MTAWLLVLILVLLAIVLFAVAWVFSTNWGRWGDVWAARCAVAGLACVILALLIAVAKFLQWAIG